MPGADGSADGESSVGPRSRTPSCLFAHREASLGSAQGCKAQFKPKHWRRLLRILFSCHVADLGASVRMTGKHQRRACSRLPALRSVEKLRTSQLLQRLPGNLLWFLEHACVRAYVRAHICGSGCFSICREGASVFRRQSSRSNSFWDPRSAFQHWSRAPTTRIRTVGMTTSPSWRYQRTCT